MYMYKYIQLSVHLFFPLNVTQHETADLCTQNTLIRVINVAIGTWLSPLLFKISSYVFRFNSL